MIKFNHKRLIVARIQQPEAVCKSRDRQETISRLFCFQEVFMLFVGALIDIALLGLMIAWIFMGGGNDEQ